MDKIIEYLKNLVQRSFWGKIELIFENGKVVHIKEIRQVKLDK